MKSLLSLVLLFAANTILAQGFDCENVSRTSTQSTRDEIYEMVGVLKDLYQNEDKKIPEDEYEDFKYEYISLRSEYNTFYSKVRDDIASGYLFTGENVICREYKDEIVELEDRATRYLQVISKYIREKRTSKFFMINNSMAMIAIGPAAAGLAGFLFWAADQGAKMKAESFYKQVSWKSWKEINS